MSEGVIHSVLGQPLSFNNSTSSVLRSNSTTINNMISSMDIRASTGLNSSEYYHDLGSHIDIAEDFFIEDLCEFSNEEIGAPIMNANAAFLGTSSLPQHSDDNTSASISKDPSSSTIKTSECTPAHTSTSGSVLFHGSPAALDPLHLEMDSSLSLPCQDEVGFEWLTSLGDDDLIYGASNFGMESFLLSSVEAFSSSYDGLMKHGGYEDEGKANDMKVGHIINDEQAHHGGSSGGGGGDQSRWDNEDDGVKDLDASMFMPHSTGSRSARSKRARSAGWSSSSILCDDDSPTNSLNSTSQMMPNPPYVSSPTFMGKQEENDEQQYGCTTTHSSLIGAAISRDMKPLSEASKSKFCSVDQALNGKWAKEDARAESVSNHGGGLAPRRCTHCLSQKTPQWRAGPQGPKTLCNACGVRYKSGRLFDEYRPAKSPTFLSYKHSNSHKKVMEMRRRKAFQYSSNHHQQYAAAAAHRAARAPPPPLKHAAEAHPHLINKLKVKHSEPHSHFSDVTLISTQTTLEGPSSFLY